MSNARNLAKVAVDANGDIGTASLDNLTGALGYTPVNKAGDTMTGDLIVNTNVGIGTSSPSSFYSLADNLVVGTGSSGNGITVYSGSDSSGYIGFNDTASASMQGFIQYNHAGDYMALAPNGSEKMRIDSAGRVTMPYQPAFAASYGGGTLADQTIIPWNVIHFNTGNCYNSANGRFTAPVAGKYMFHAQIHHSSGSGTPPSHQYFDFRVNGAGAGRFIGRWNFDDWYELNGTFMFSLNVNDYVEVVVYVANNQWLGSNRSDHNRFQGYLIG